MALFQEIHFATEFLKITLTELKDCHPCVNTGIESQAAKDAIPSC